MKWYRIKALLIRHLYLNKRSIPRIMDIFFWPIMTILLWGFLSLYLEKSNLTGLNIITILMGAILLWEILSESQHSLSVAFLEEVWEKNLINIFVAPLKISEFIVSTILLGIVRVFLAASVMALLAFIAYSFNIFTFGLNLIPFVINLLIFGWALGLFITAVILRYGTSAQVLAFGIIFVVQPFTAVFYPVSVLPGIIKYIALALPSTHVFEGMRAVVATGGIPAFNFTMAIILNIIYLILASMFFYKMFSRVKEKGTMLKLNQ
jgi:ABC-2 type transport system permease protein